MNRVHTKDSPPEAVYLNIAIIGAGGAGKTELVSRVLEKVPQEDRGPVEVLHVGDTRTFGLEILPRGMPNHEGKPVHLMLRSFSGYTKSDQVWLRLLDHQHAVLFLADARRDRIHKTLATLEMVVAMLDDLYGEDKPALLIAFNHIADPRALDPTEVEHYLKRPDREILTLSTESGKGVFIAFRALCDAALENLRGDGGNIAEEKRKQPEEGIQTQQGDEGERGHLDLPVFQEQDSARSRGLFGWVRDALRKLP